MAFLVMGWLLRGHHPKATSIFPMIGLPLDFSVKDGELGSFWGSGFHPGCHSRWSQHQQEQCWNFHYLLFSGTSNIFGIFTPRMFGVSVIQFDNCAYFFRWLGEKTPTRKPWLVVLIYPREVEQLAPEKRWDWKTSLSSWVLVTFQGLLLLNFGRVGDYTTQQLWGCFDEANGMAAKDFDPNSWFEWFQGPRSLQKSYTPGSTSITGWKMDPDWYISYWKWAYSSQLCDELPEGSWSIATSVSIRVWNRFLDFKGAAVQHPGCLLRCSSRNMLMKLFTHFFGGEVCSF